MAPAPSLRPARHQEEPRRKLLASHPISFRLLPLIHFPRELSIAQNIPPVLLIALVEKKVWTLNQGLAYVRQIPDQAQQVVVLEGLACRLAELGYYRESLAVALEIEHEWSRAETLVRLVPHLPELLLWEVLAVIKAIASIWSQADLLVRLAPHFSELLLQETLAVVAV